MFVLGDSSFYLTLHKYNYYCLFYLLVDQSRHEKVDYNALDFEEDIEHDGMYCLHNMCIF